MFTCFYLLNAQGIEPKSTSGNKWKIQYISENLLNRRKDVNSSCLFLSVTESWTKEYMTNAQLKIPNFNVFRCDRKTRTRGGSLLYIHESMLVSNVEKYDDSVCEVIMCYIENSRNIVASVYRPPDASHQSFTKALTALQAYLDEHQTNDTTIYITGDFNCPQIDWNSLTFQRSQGIQASESCDALLNFMTKNFLNQIVHQPTRGRNVLDLVLTNASDNVIETEVNPTLLSDHKLVKITLGYNAFSNDFIRKPKEYLPFTFHGLNVHRGDFTVMNAELARINWAEVFSLCQDHQKGKEFAEFMRLTVLQLCCEFCPQKASNSGKLKISRERQILQRRRRKLRSTLRLTRLRNPKSLTITKIEEDICLINIAIRNSILDQRRTEEKNALETMKQNPSYFYSYAKRFSRLKSNIGPLREGSHLKQHPEEMANILQGEYFNAFSNPDSKNLKITLSEEHGSTNILSDISFTRTDIINAINELDPQSATAHENIPARILKECKEALSVPLHILWKWSFENGEVPANFKKQYITPIFKKGDKTKASNYRPLALTPHDIKSFERVVRDFIVEHLEKNDLLDPNQHGFRKGRSCLTQLLQHYDSILQNYNSGAETDVLYLDFAKAFDKVDHNLLIAKLQIYGIQGKLLDWIRSFLRDRSQIVTVDGFHSVEKPVLSGIPQGSVLGPILFIIYVNDLHFHIQNCKSSAFADDTKIQRKITKVGDMEIVNVEIQNATDWSIKNNMLLNDLKFVYLRYEIKKK